MKTSMSSVVVSRPILNLMALMAIEWGTPTARRTEEGLQNEDNCANQTVTTYISLRRNTVNLYGGDLKMIWWIRLTAQHNCNKFSMKTVSCIIMFLENAYLQIFFIVYKAIACYLFRHVASSYMYNSWQLTVLSALLLC